MPLTIGAPALGHDFFDRKIERAQLWRSLHGNHLVLSGPRRLGKTSLLKRLAEEAAAHGLLAVYLDASATHDAHGLMRAISALLPEATIAAHLKGASQRVAQWMHSIGRIRIDAGELGGVELETRAAEATTWQQAAMPIQQRLTPRPVLIIVDEFSVFLMGLLKRDPAQARDLMLFLRAWRQGGPLACRFIFSGSIGLNRLLERHGLQTETNDCDDFRLGPFAPADAADMVCSLALREGWPLDEEAARALCLKVGWLSPYYLCCMLEEAIRAAMFRLRQTQPCGAPLAVADIDSAHAQMLDTRSRFVHWHKRLAELFAAPDFAWTQKALARLAGRDQGLLHTTLMAGTPPPQADEHLLVLEEHGYIARDGQRWQFQSPLLRQYWKKNHGR